MGTVLVVYHTLGGNTKAAAEAVADGARKAGADVNVMPALQAGPTEMMSCAALAVGTPDYFSYMAGGLKDFFDRCFYPTQGKVTDKPCGVFVTHGGGGKAVESVKQMLRSFKLRLACAPVMVQNHPDAGAKEKLAELGALLAKLAEA